MQKNHRLIEGSQVAYLNVICISSTGLSNPFSSSSTCVPLSKLINQLSLPSIDICQHLLQGLGEMLRETKVGHSLSSKEGRHHSLQNSEGLLRITGRLCPVPQREIKTALEDRPHLCWVQMCPPESCVRN